MLKKFLFTVLLFSCFSVQAQHRIRIFAEVDHKRKVIGVRQEIVFVNNSAERLEFLVLSDWNNAFLGKETPLAKRFSDEFIRAFHLAKDHERGQTSNISILDANRHFLQWQRPNGKPDLLEVQLREPLAPGDSTRIELTYFLKIPSDRFTKFGYSDDGFLLRDVFLMPARIEKGEFVRYSHENLDDSALAPFDISLEIRTLPGFEVFSDLDQGQPHDQKDYRTFSLQGSNRTDFTIAIGQKEDYHSFKNASVEVVNGLMDSRVDDISRAMIVDRVVEYVQANIGDFPHEKIIVTQADYDRNPFYGLNQLPSFIRPFPDDFVYEIKFLKTYLHNFLSQSLQLDPRKDNYIFDALQVYTMMRYMDEYHPSAKMMGSLSNLRILKGYNFMNVGFNEQYSYFYMLMARKNLDQPIGEPKDELIKFNEQIAGKYRAGLSLSYLDHYLGGDIVPAAIRNFYAEASKRKVSQTDFESALKSRAGKDIDWFFDTVIHSRRLIDFKFDKVAPTADSISFTFKNRTGTQVPIPVSGVSRGKELFKFWIDNPATDSLFTVPRLGADKIVINYANEVPEYNLRNNWRSLREFSISNRPIRFRPVKDLEDPYYNQVLYVPTLTYNLYDGLSPGIRFHNKTILDKPIVFDFNPVYSTNQKTFTGSFLAAVNQNIREGRLYLIRYSASGNYFHYAPDAAYLRLNPMVMFRIREDNFRDNRNQTILLRQVIVDRQETDYVIDNSEENYTVFDAKYINSRTEATRHQRFVADFQAAGKFGKAIAEAGFRRLFANNRQVDIRVFAGTFLYNNTDSDYFSFALDRPTDYLFDYNYYGRSESTGIFSQQLVVSEGGFKSKLATPYANRWMATTNVGVNVWNWVEVYADAGWIKNRGQDPHFVYDSGIRLNLVTDYFELYFPVNSSNGWEIAQPNYHEKIRFIVTLDPRILVGLFTRKWF